MALNTSNCKHLMPLHFKGLMSCFRTAQILHSIISSRQQKANFMK